MRQPSPPDAKKDRKAKLDRKLDHAVEETFPASDPIAVSAPERKGPDGKSILPQRTGAPPPPSKDRHRRPS